MVNKIVILVDAGYFYAQSCEVIFGGPRRRDELDLDEAKTIEMIQSVAKETYPTAGFLRMYWYDAPPSRGQQMSASQEKIGLSDGVKLRLGTLNGNGQQKGVDALICRDMEELAENKAADSFLLVSGDEDLRLAMEFAQAHGAKVKVCGVGSGNASIGMGLGMESDGVRKILKEQLAGLIKLKQTRPVVNSGVQTPSMPENRNIQANSNHPNVPQNQFGKSKSAHKRARKSAAKKNGGHAPQQAHVQNSGSSQNPPRTESQNHVKPIDQDRFEQVKTVHHVKQDVVKPVELKDFVHGIPAKPAFQSERVVDVLPIIGAVVTSPVQLDGSVASTGIKGRRAPKKVVEGAKPKAPAKKRIAKPKAD